MNKITCEICGTTYQEENGCCPICGWSSEDKMDPVDPEFDLETIGEAITEDSPMTQAEVDKKPREIFDYDAVNTANRAAAKTAAKVPPVVAHHQAASIEEDEYSDEEEEPQTNVLMVVVLVILILALLLTTGYMFVKFFLPGRNNAQDEVPTATVQTEETLPAEEETEPEPAEIPCTSLSVSGGIDVLNAAGQNWLLNVIALPEDTTDQVSFSSEDESIATVSEDGLITAVAEGETKIIITCGEQSLSCPVVVKYESATEPTEAETLPPVEPKETEATKPSKGSVEVKLKKHDITFGRNGVYIDLELDCDLDPEDVEWVTENSYVANVNNGRLTVTGPGITVIHAKYNGSEDTCVVRCNFK